MGKGQATRCQSDMQKEIIQTSRILIVDDQPQNVLLLERTLQGAGYRNLAGVTDSRKVLRTFTEFHPDLVRIPGQDEQDSGVNAKSIPGRRRTRFRAEDEQ